MTKYRMMQCARIAAGIDGYIDHLSEADRKQRFINYENILLNLKNKGESYEDQGGFDGQVRKVWKRRMLLP